MQLKEFVKNALKDVVEAVEEVKGESSRDMHLDGSKDQRTVEFDIAVTVEDTVSGTGKAGIRVFSVLEGGGEASKELRNSTVSRIQFGVHVDRFTKCENAEMDAANAARNARQENFDPYSPI
jgi:hypothetical protein